MIHEIEEEIFTLPLDEYTLTFDDGLYSQYYYRDYIQKYDTEKIFFISSGIVCTGKQSREFLNCIDAHKQAFNGDMSQYMTIEQIKELLHSDQCTIGAHSHSHKRLSLFSTLVEKVNHIEEDTETMLEWFQKNLNYTPTKFCFPYNEDMDGLYKALLKKYGFTEFHGHERIPVEKLLRDDNQ